MKEDRRKKMLVEKLIMLSLFGATGSGGGPGYYVKRLGEKDKETVKKLKAKDFNHRIN